MNLDTDTDSRVRKNAGKVMACFIPRKLMVDFVRSVRLLAVAEKFDVLVGGQFSGMGELDRRRQLAALGWKRMHHAGCFMNQREWNEGEWEESCGRNP